MKKMMVMLSAVALIAAWNLPVNAGCGTCDKDAAKKECKCENCKKAGACDKCDCKDAKCECCKNKDKKAE